MSRLVRPLLRAAAVLDDRLDARWFQIKQRLGRVRPVLILPYLGFGTPAALYLKGRVLEEKGVANAGERDTVWKNARMAYRRFQSDEVPHVRVRATAFGAEAVAETDREGYFDIVLQPQEPLPADVLWHEVALELLDPVVPGQGRVCATGRVQVPPADADFGIISDIDDTVLQTGATRLLQMARLTFFHNAHTRTPFEGVSAFYRALEQGLGSGARNPIFYVSSSPWNLYDLLLQFFELQDIPAGTLMLRDLGLEVGPLVDLRHETHKLAQIDRVMMTYPGLRFILIGDSGQRDPEIYAEVVERYAGRVCAVYIREVTSGLREAQVNTLAEQVRRRGVDLLLVRDTAAAVRHAIAHGYIRPDRFAATVDGTIANPAPIAAVAEEALTGTASPP